MSKSSIIYERRDSLAIIRLNRPEKLNALSREMIKALSGAFEELERQAKSSAVILTGAGDRAFCVGTDISELSLSTNLKRGKLQGWVRQSVIRSRVSLCR